MLVNTGAGVWERVKGIEPSLRAWEARVLPLNYTRNCPKDRATGDACLRVGGPVVGGYLGG